METLQDPTASHDATEHADWLELVAVTTADHNSSRQDLMTAIRRTGSIDSAHDSEGFTDDDAPLDDAVEGEDEVLEPIADAAFVQLELREAYLGVNYPFAISDGALQAKDGAATSPYAFLTTLTYFGPQAGAKGATSLFERLSAAALVQYLGGSTTVDSYNFGFPRHDGPKSFIKAIKDLCSKMGEGLGCRDNGSTAQNAKDAKLDLVAWVPFGDDRRNQVSVFGQCAAGKYWLGKLNELQPVDFCKRWLQEQPAMSPLSAFFVPRHFADNEWSEASVGERVLFDRLRIARSLGGLEEDLARRCAEWTASTIISGPIR